LYVFVEFVGNLFAKPPSPRDFLDEFQELWPDLLVVTEACNRVRELARSARVAF
jgi:hypothetical protein